MTEHGRRRLRTWLYWVFRARHRLRRAIYFADPGRVCLGDRMTVFDGDGNPVCAEVVSIDQWGRGRLVRDDGVVIERQLT